MSLRDRPAQHNWNSASVTPAWVGIVGLSLLVGLSCTRPTGPSGNSWRLLPGQVERLSYAPFRDGRTCWVYLPPGYTTGERRYPVLYLNDGEAAFDGGNALHVNRICEDLIRSGEMEPIIVVAIETMSIENRWYDYTPWIDPYWPVRQGGGDAYIRAIRDTLKPEIDRRYRTLPDAGHTAMGGMSLGGLMSAYAGYYYDGTFGRVAAFSPTYGWGGDNLVHYAASHSKPRIVRFYQDTGTIGDNYIGEMRDVAIAQGFMEGQDFMSIVAEYATHTTPCWEHRFPGMLRFVFRP